MSDASNFAENEIADYLGANCAPSSVSNVYIKLHTGAPGEDGTSNAATETTREEATFDAASGGAVALTATVTWTNVSTTESVSHISAWDDPSAGNCLFVGALSAPVSLTAGDNLNLTALTVTVA
jgi:hypothetical protein